MRHKIIYCIGFLLALGAFFILPSDDDFYSLPAPHVLESWNVFLPNGAFWRPIDAAWGILMGKCVGAFPYLNHLMVLLLYAFCVYGLARTLDYCRVGRMTKNLSMGIFLLSPALVATVYSIDSINQVLCTAFGIASVLLYRKQKIVSYLMMILALFSKESGIAWLVATPLLSLVIEEEQQGSVCIDLKKYKQLVKPYIGSFLIIGGYFVLRLLLRQPGVMETSGNYAGGLGLNSLMGLVMLMGVSLTTIDTVALFLERNWIVVIASVVVSLLFLIVFLRKFICLRRTYWLRLFECLVITMMLTAPHLVMGHPGEMHAFPTLWGVALSVGIVLKNTQWLRWEKNTITIFLICCVLVYLHKGYYMYQAGLFAKQRVESAVANSKTIPHSVCILDCDPPIVPEYSVFRATGELCWYKGWATRVYFDLVNPKKTEYYVIRPKELEKYLQKAETTHKYDAVWIVKDNQVKVIEVN